MIGRGIPISHSSAPLPKPMLISSGCCGITISLLGPGSIVGQEFAGGT
jgi:hypothetical protein